jgi:hypothetical protein
MSVAAVIDQADAEVASGAAQSPPDHCEFALATQRERAQFLGCEVERTRAGLVICILALRFLAKVLLEMSLPFIAIKGK